MADFSLFQPAPTSHAFSHAPVTSPDFNAPPPTEVFFDVPDFNASTGIFTWLKVRSDQMTAMMWQAREDADALYKQLWVRCSGIVFSNVRVQC